MLEQKKVKSYFLLPGSIRLYSSFLFTGGAWLVFFGGPTKGRQFVNLFKLALKFSDFIDSFDRPIIFVLVITS